MATQRTLTIQPAVASATAVRAAIVLAAVPLTVVTSITDPDVCRVLSITGNAAGMAGNVSVTVIDRTGVTRTDAIALNGTATVLGVVPAASVSTIVVPARTHAGDTVTVGYGDVFGLSGNICASEDVSQAERMASGATIFTAEAVGSVNPDYNTVAAVIVAGDDMRWTYYDRGITGADLDKLRRMIAEPTTTAYSDLLLAEYISANPLSDNDGYTSEDVLWTPTYDLNRSASVIWYEKAMTHTGEYQFSADGSTFNRQQVYAMCMKAAARYSSMAAPATLTIKVDHDYERDYQSTYWSEENQSSGGTDTSYIANGPQPGEDD